MLIALYEGGVSEQQIAEETGISQATVNRIRNGVHGEPKHSTWAAISQLYLKKQAEAARPAAAGEGDHAAG